MDRWIRVFVFSCLFGFLHSFLPSSFHVTFIFFGGSNWLNLVYSIFIICIFLANEDSMQILQALHYTQNALRVLGFAYSEVPAISALNPHSQKRSANNKYTIDQVERNLIFVGLKHDRSGARGESLMQ